MTRAAGRVETAFPRRFPHRSSGDLSRPPDGQYTASYNARRSAGVTGTGFVR